MKNSADGGKRSSENPILNDLVFEESKDPFAYKKDRRLRAGRKTPAARAAFQLLVREIQVQVADLQRQSRHVTTEIKNLAERKRVLKALIAERSRLAEQFKEFAK